MCLKDRGYELEITKPKSLRETAEIRLSCGSGFQRRSINITCAEGSLGEGRWVIGSKDLEEMAGEAFCEEIAGYCSLIPTDGNNFAFPFTARKGEVLSAETVSNHCPPFYHVLEGLTCEPFWLTTGYWNVAAECVPNYDISFLVKLLEYMNLHKAGNQLIENGIYQYDDFEALFLKVKDTLVFGILPEYLGPKVLELEFELDENGFGFYSTVLGKRYFVRNKSDLNVMIRESNFMLKTCSGDFLNFDGPLVRELDTGVHHNNQSNHCKTGFTPLFENNFKCVLKEDGQAHWDYDIEPKCIF